MFTAHCVLHTYKLQSSISHRLTNTGAVICAGLPRGGCAATTAHIMKSPPNLRVVHRKLQAPRGPVLTCVAASDSVTRRALYAVHQVVYDTAAGHGQSDPSARPATVRGYSQAWRRAPRRSMHPAIHIDTHKTDVNKKPTALVASYRTTNSRNALHLFSCTIPNTKPPPFNTKLSRTAA